MNHVSGHGSHTANTWQLHTRIWTVARIWNVSQLTPGFLRDHLQSHRTFRPAVINKASSNACGKVQARCQSHVCFCVLRIADVSERLRQQIRRKAKLSRAASANQRCVQTFHTVYAPLVTLFTIRLPCSKDRSKMILARRLAARLLAKVIFCWLSSNIQRRCIRDHAVQCMPQAMRFLCGQSLQQLCQY